MQDSDHCAFDATSRILKATEDITAAIQRTPGLFVLGEPKAMIVAFGSNDFNIYALSDVMGKRGFGELHGTCMR